VRLALQLGASAAKTLDFRSGLTYRFLIVAAMKHAERSIARLQAGGCSSENGTVEEDTP